MENNYRIAQTTCTFKTIYKTSAKFPKDWNKIEENKYTFYPRLAEVTSSQVEKK